MIEVKVCQAQTEWDEQVLSRAGHPLQLWGWGEVKGVHGWQVERVFVQENGTIIGAAQLLIKRLPLPFRAFVYIPRGPVTMSQDREKVLSKLASYVKRRYSAIVLTIEPDCEGALELREWRKSDNTILIPRTLILDLSKSEDELLGAMAKKTRQYIRKSNNEDVTIRQVKSREELEKCMAIYHETAVRAGFALHDDQYYYDIFDKLGDHSPVLAAFYNEQPVAFLWLAISSETAFELYGGMNDDGQRLRANYVLKWHAITLMKRWGIKRYDFNGLLNDGVSTFKQGFANHENLLIGTFDKSLSPLYYLWSKGLPLAKKILRTVKNR